MSLSNLKAEDRRIVVKVGSAQLIDPQTGQVRQDRFDAIADDVVELRARGHQVAIVSSGAVAVGIGQVEFELNRIPLAGKQALSAVGQPVLMAHWQKAFSRHRIVCAQALLTPSDTEIRTHWLNARNTLEGLFDLQTVPIVNENDTVATEELRFGDNDRLAARVAQLIGAGRLIILSDVDGLYDRPPSDKAAAHIPTVSTITAEIEAMAGGAIRSGVGTGGMASKIAAAKIAMAAGCRVIIARGDGNHPIRAIEEGARHTLFEASQTPYRARQAWIRGLMTSEGAKIVLDKGACRAVRQGSSLLPVGVTGVEGEFERGAAVRLFNEDDQAFATGLINYDSREARLLVGARREDIEDRLGYRASFMLVHTNNLVLDEGQRTGPESEL